MSNEKAGSVGGVGGVGSVGGVATQQSKNLVSTDRFEELEFNGLEEVGAEDLAIPFIRVLQSGSPQVKKSDGAYVKDAGEGDIYNSVQNIIYDGKTGIKVIPCYYNRRFVEWIPRNQDGGGYVGSHLVNDPIVQTTVPNEKGTPILPNGNELLNTANFYCLVLINDQPQHVLIPMSSSKLKKAKQWITMAQTKTFTKENGQVSVQPLFANVYHLTTVSETNKHGTYANWAVKHEKSLDITASPMEEMWFETAFSFAKSVKADEVRAVDSPENVDTVTDSDDNAVM
tara:strand:- start:8634 stop:9488 length:855 start_codon:yes stop_codon:yes gene_type:complete